MKQPQRSRTLIPKSKALAASKLAQQWNGMDYWHRGNMLREQLPTSTIKKLWPLMNQSERKECVTYQKLPSDSIATWWPKVSSTVRYFLLRYQEWTVELTERFWEDMTNVNKSFCIRYQILTPEYMTAQWERMDFDHRTLCCLYQVPPPDLVLTHWDNMRFEEQVAAIDGKCFLNLPVAYLPQFLTMKSDTLRQLVIQQLKKRREEEAI